MDAYPDHGERRILAGEIRDHVARRVGSSLVNGFAAMVDPGGARGPGDRVAGFMETHDRREWTLALSAAEGMTWQTQAVPEATCRAVSFVLSVGFGNGSPLPQPSGAWAIHVNGRHACSVRVVKHSQLWRGGASCSFAFAANRIEAAEPFGSLTLSSIIRDESFAAFGPALLTVPAEWLTPGSPATIRVATECCADSTRWLQVATAPGIVDQSDIYRAADLLTDARVPEIGGSHVYFGDIHTHSGQVGDDTTNKGCGYGTREGNYAYARGPGGLDFYSLTDHEWQIGQDEVAGYLGLADEHNEDGRFVCLAGFEFTSLLYGHRNVYFRGPGGTVVNATRGWGRPTKEPAQALHPEELWGALEQTGVPFITVPHHPSAASHPFNWSIFSPTHDRLVEVYSAWGSSEYYGDFPRGVSDRYRSLTVRDGLGRGYRFGIIASADGHDGHPGNAQSPLVKHHHLFHHCGSGWAGVFCEELTREAVFDALHARRCYGTTGVPIVLSFEVNGRPMGSEIAPDADGRVVVRVSCRGANGIDHVRIVRNGRVAHTVPCHGERRAEIEWQDVAYVPSAPGVYYARVVQIDRESAWSSPVWVG